MSMILQTNAKNPLLNEIKVQYDKILDLLALRGIDAARPSLNTYLILEKKDNDFLTRVLKLLESYYRILASFAAQEEVTDKQLVKKALSEFGLRLSSDHDNLDFINTDVIVEIYDSSMIQLYRNFTFFKQCSYDLITLLTHEWHILYERSSLVTQSIFTKVKEALSGEIDFISYNITPHILREKYIDEGSIFEVEMQYILPVFNVTTNEIAGVLHTVLSHPLLDSEQSKKIVQI
jgi:hypothetical protein